MVGLWACRQLVVRRAAMCRRMSRIGVQGTGLGDSMRRREENSLRVTNLSEDTREDDLRVCDSQMRTCLCIAAPASLECPSSQGSDLTCPWLLPLQDLFSPFGPISRIYIAYDRETGENRGFGFVNFTYKFVPVLLEVLLTNASARYSA